MHKFLEVTKTQNLVVFSDSLCEWVALRNDFEAAVEKIKLEIDFPICESQHQMAYKMLHELLSNSVCTFSSVVSETPNTYHISPYLNELTCLITEECYDYM